MTSETAEREPELRPLWPYAVAVLFPPVGFVLGVIEASKGYTGRGAELMVLAIVAALAAVFLL